MKEAWDKNVKGSSHSQAVRLAFILDRVRAVLEHYEAQTEEEAVAEDEAAYE